MNKDQILLSPESKADLTTTETITLLIWILFKLTLLASMVNKGAAEFIYAGF
jgi:hypothetical protein